MKEKKIKTSKKVEGTKKKEVKTSKKLDEIKAKEVKTSKKVVEKVNFDLSLLSLKDLIETYQEIDEFVKFTQDKRIIEQKVEDE